MSKQPNSNSIKNKQQAQEHLLALRHTAEHVLHQAMTDLFPGLLRAMGPPTEDGFYFDFDYEQGKVQEEDLPRIEKRMRELIKKDLPIVRQEIEVAEARQLFAGNPYKQEWIEQIEQAGEKASVYWTGEPNQPESDVDLCKGPHVSSTGEVKAFKLLSIAGAYWHGDEKNKMLTRIYGTAFPTKEELKHFLWQREEAKKRDHRKIGQKLGLFMFDEEFGQGLPLYKPKGAMLRKLIMDFAFESYLGRGYQPVATPHIARKALWETSGHWQFYRDSMYSPMEIDGEEYVIKPMNCPGHVKIYNSDLHSYRDLPVRLAEMGTVYRYEKSGELNGILRPRAFTQDDAHIICTPDQLAEELVEMIDLTNYIYSKFGFADPEISLSVRDPFNKTKYMGDDDKWALAEQALEAALIKKKMSYQRIEGEAAFYGPKIDFMFKDALGREQQLTTIQVDFNLPEKFSMYYIDEEGEKQQPFMLHRALLGSLERFMGVLIEHTAGNFPFWLSPVQVKVLPITDEQIEYARQVAKQLGEQGMRVEVDDRSATLGNKIRQAEEERIPLMLIVGAKEAERGEVSVRERDKKEQKVMKVEELGEKGKMGVEKIEN